MTLSSKEKVQVLLGVWGEDYIKNFLAFGLPSLLAPGNLPALTSAYPTQFIFLTRAEHTTFFEKHPAFQKLKTICSIGFVVIDDLIMDRNHSTTITLAYDRAIRKTGPAMLKTYFVFLTADYIMADGSLAGLMRYMKKGYSGICAGNFQVNEEEIQPFLKQHLDSNKQVLQVSPRVLLKESFTHFHTTTMASLYEEGNIHNEEVNRFFLRYNANVLVGRFYLLHMLCVKPEIESYQIGASCDYSFIPEMCPSGNIAIIEDSDDYLVVEMQPKEHDLNHIRFGAYHLEAVLLSLAKWTTVQHRRNIEHAIYYHTTDLSKELKNTIKEKSDHFINKLNSRLEVYPAKPHRNHPYWIGAINALNQYKRAVANYGSFQDRHLSFATNRGRKKILHSFRFPYSFTRLHYKWLEQHLAKITVKEIVSSYDAEKIIILYDSSELEFQNYCRWLQQDLKINHHCALEIVNSEKAVLKKLKEKEFEFCLFFLTFQNIERLPKALTSIQYLLSASQKATVFILKNDYLNFSYDFQNHMASNLHYLNNKNFRILSIYTIKNNFSLFGAILIEWIKKTFYSKILRQFFYYATTGCFVLFCLIRNILTRSGAKQNYCTAVLINLVLEKIEE